MFWDQLRSCTHILPGTGVLTAAGQKHNVREAQPKGKLRYLYKAAENFSGKEISRKTRSALEPGAFNFRFGPGQTPAKVIPTLLKSLAHKTKAHADHNRTFQAFNQGQKD